MKTKSIIIILLCIVMQWNTIGESTDQPTIMTGKISTIRLIEVGRIQTDVLRDQCPAAKDGVMFTFQIMSKYGETGLFTLTELRDFKIDGVNYRKHNAGRSPLSVEPITVIEDIDDFVTQYRPDLKGVIEPTEKIKSVIMMTGICGRPLPVSGNCTVSIEIGWGERTEIFTFKFKLLDFREARTKLKKQ